VIVPVSLSMIGVAVAEPWIRTVGANSVEYPLPALSTVREAIRPSSSRTALAVAPEPPASMSSRVFCAGLRKRKSPLRQTIWEPAGKSTTAEVSTSPTGVRREIVPMPSPTPASEPRWELEREAFR